MIEVLRRIPDFKVVPGAAHRYERPGTVNGWEQMPVAFTRAGARAAA